MLLVNSRMTGKKPAWYLKIDCYDIAKLIKVAVDMFKNNSFHYFAHT